MSELNGTKKIQWSIFTPNQKEQYVIRVDTWEEFVELKGKVLAEMPKNAAFPDDIGSPTATPASNVQESAPTCAVHKTPMKWVPPGVSRSTGKQYPGFYSCGVKNTDGSFCNYRPNGK